MSASVPNEAFQTDKQHYFDLYKLCVEMADRISQRRAQANSFFVIAETLLVGVFALGVKTSDPKTLPIAFIAWSVGLFGCLLSTVWLITIHSYRQLNSGKFKIILEMEKKLPFDPYSQEWIVLGKGADSKKYRHLLT